MGEQAAGGTLIALLRGINVGGRNKLAMAELRAMFEAAGCRNVQSYIQSGNVVFEAGPEQAERIAAEIQRAIAAQYGYEIPLVTRTAGELRSIVEANPFSDSQVDPKQLHVSFLAAQPTPERLARLDPDRSAPDQFVAAGSEIYLKLPNGVARTKLTNAYFDATLGTTSTMRNWRTTLRLLEMAS